MRIDTTLLESIAAIAREAGAAILQVYNRPDGNLGVTEKGDNSPLTEADIAAHHAIVNGLAELGTGWPVLSEEENDDITPAERRRWMRYWLVDPLDGTKEFIKRNGEFTVNIALIDDGIPVLGVVYVPVTGVTYLGLAGAGAWKEENGRRRVIRVRSLEAARGSGKPVIVASRSHGGDALAPLLADIEREIGAFETVSMGSSLKICLVAEGAADLYPRLGPTSEWDTAAAQAVLEAAGGSMLAPDLEPLRCNTRDTLLNPHFVCLGDDVARWGVLEGRLGG